MNNLKYPNFILAIISFIILFIGIEPQVNGYGSGMYVIGARILLAGIHWIWSIIDVTKATDRKPYQKRFWLIIEVAAPAVGSLFFYAMHQRCGRIVT